ncbi:MAG: DUF58 domain-containing protein [Verrucomicrobiota bacterium]
MPVSKNIDELFSPGYLRQLEALSLAARQLVRGRMRAERKSHQRGASVEFAEYRPFAEGDDLRNVDWHAYARWRQLVIKLYVEEEDLHVHILLDHSMSMDWGEVNKFDYARQLAGGLAYLALGNMDRVGVTLTGDRSASHWPVSRGKGHLLPLLRFLTAADVTGQALPMEKAVQRWMISKPRRGLVLVLSDFWGQDPQDARQALNRIRYGGHEVALIQIISPDELEAGSYGEYEIRESDYGQQMKVVVDAAMVRNYHKQLEDYQQQLQAYCKRYQIPFLQANTREPVEELLLTSLRHGGYIR